jgi:hypothetical protein
MPRFRIAGTRRNPTTGSVFEVEWLSGQLSVGETFPVREAGHTYNVTVLAVAQHQSRASLQCDIALAFDMQFAPAIVDTEAPAREQFRYADA